MNDILEPCPVCGPDHEDDLYIEEIKPDVAGYWIVRCRRCGLKIEQSHKPKLAILTWNVMAYNHRQEAAMKEVTRTTTDRGNEISCDGNRSIIGRTETVETGQESSVEISQNAKGHAQVSVKVYHADAEQAAIEAVALYRRTVAALASGGRV